MTQAIKLVILDRDGVINEERDDYVKSPEEWVPLPGSLEAIARLNHANVRVAVATNQSGVARGLLSLLDLNRIHAKLRDTLARVGGHVDGIFFCPHGPGDGCDCRKPATGLLRAISHRFAIPLAQVPVIGDSERDVAAATAVRASPMLVRTGNGRRTLETHPELAELPCFDDLAEAVDALMHGRLGT